MNTGNCAAVVRVGLLPLFFILAGNEFGRNFLAVTSCEASRIYFRGKEQAIIPSTGEILLESRWNEHSVVPLWRVTESTLHIQYPQPAKFGLREGNKPMNFGTFVYNPSTGQLEKPLKSRFSAIASNFATDANDVICSMAFRLKAEPSASQPTPGRFSLERFQAKRASREASSSASGDLWPEDEDTQRDWSLSHVMRHVGEALERIPFLASVSDERNLSAESYEESTGKRASRSNADTADDSDSSASNPARLQGNLAETAEMMDGSSQSTPDRFHGKSHQPAHSEVRHQGGEARKVPFDESNPNIEAEVTEDGTNSGRTASTGENGSYSSETAESELESVDSKEVEKYESMVVQQQESLGKFMKQESPENNKVRNWLGARQGDFRRVIPEDSSKKAAVLGGPGNIAMKLKLSLRVKQKEDLFKSTWTFVAKNSLELSGDSDSVCVVTMVNGDLEPQSGFLQWITEGTHGAIAICMRDSHGEQTKTESISDTIQVIKGHVAVRFVES